MTRIIQSKRDTSTGENYFNCPEAPGDRYFPEGILCDSCRAHGCQIESLPARFRVHCNFAQTSKLDEFEPPKAHDSVGGLKGIEVAKSKRHSWAEPKLDGARALVHITPDGVFITSRRRNKDGEYNQFGDNVPHILSALAPLGRNGYTILDGEICMEADWRNGESNLGLTMGVVGAHPEKAIALQKARGKAVLKVFDSPKIFGRDQTGASMVERNLALSALFTEWKLGMAGFPTQILELVPHWYTEGEEDILRIFERVTDREGLEGLVLKDPDAAYNDSRAWLKLKPKVTIDAQIIGAERGAAGGKYQNIVGALVTAVYGPDGILTEVCKVAPGDDAARMYWTKLESMTRQQIVDAGFIVEIEGQGWSKDLRIRHPRVVKYRADLSSPQVVDFSEVKRI